MTSETRTVSSDHGPSDKGLALEWLGADHGRGFDCVMRRHNHGLRGIPERSVARGGHLHRERAQVMGARLRASAALSMLVVTASAGG